MPYLIDTHVLIWQLNEPEKLSDTVRNIIIHSNHLAHLEQYRSLSFIHKDPFDRILIAQALSDNLMILTKDQAIQQYPIKAIW